MYEIQHNYNAARCGGKRKALIKTTVHSIKLPFLAVRDQCVLILQTIGNLLLKYHGPLFVIDDGLCALLGISPPMHRLAYHAVKNAQSNTALAEDKRMTHPEYCDDRLLQGRSLSPCHQFSTIIGSVSARRGAILCSLVVVLANDSTSESKIG